VDFLYTDMTQASFWVAVFQIIVVNIILSGDNAVVIALACMHLPPKQRMWGMILGAGAAVLLRILFTLVVAQAMGYPFLKLVGGLLLLWIAVKLVAEDAGGDDDKVKKGETLWQAVWIVTVADIVMSLDNVIAVAAVADGSLALLIFGLGISIPAIVAGANILMAVLNYFPLIIWAGAGLLGWIAGDVIASDPIIADYAATLGPAVPAKLKLICSIAGMAGTVGFCLVSRARARTVYLEPSE
jgi:YjbE family integral membrane protein